MDDETFNNYKKNQSSETKGFDLEQIQIISMYSTSDTLWSLSFPQIEIIKTRLKNYNDSNYDIFFNFKFSFTRPKPISNQKSRESFSYTLFITSNKSLSNKNYVNRTDILDKLYNDLTYCNKSKMNLSEFYNPSIILSADLLPIIIQDKRTSISKKEM